MKACVFGFLFFATVGARAEMFDMNKVMQAMAAGKTLAPLSSSSPPPVAPVRTAVGKVRIVKTTYTKNSTRFDIKTEEICEANGLIDVYDVRGLAGTPVIPPQITAKCAATVEGAPVEVSAVGVVFLSRGELFKSEPEADAKVFSAAAFVISSSGKAQLSQYTFNSFLSRDLSLKNGILPINPNQIVTCASGGGCEVSLPEAFSAIVEITD